MATEKSDLLRGTFDFMVLKTLHAVGAVHGYAIAHRIEQNGTDQT